MPDSPIDILTRELRDVINVVRQAHPLTLSRVMVIGALEVVKEQELRLMFDSDGDESEPDDGDTE